jgi:hypothetical protein
MKALTAGRGVLTATVDETSALALREVLDQDTASIETVVPPRSDQAKGKTQGSPCARRLTSRILLGGSLMDYWGPTSVLELELRGRPGRAHYRLNLNRG